MTERVYLQDVLAARGLRFEEGRLSGGRVTEGDRVVLDYVTPHEVWEWLETAPRCIDCNANDSLTEVCVNDQGEHLMRCSECGFEQCPELEECEWR